MELCFSTCLCIAHDKSCKAMQSTLLVSRPHPDENGCGREVIIHYSAGRAGTHKGQVHEWHSDKPPWQMLAGKKGWQLT